MARAWLYLVLICFFRIAAVTSAPLPPSTDSIVSLRTRHLPGQCSIPGNSDFYGLGIRIGIYLQWVTTFLANHFHHEAVPDNLGTSTIFLVAMFVATAVATARGTVETAEILVLSQLCFGFVFSILSIWGYRTSSRAGEKPIRFPLIPAYFRLMLATAISAYGLWFWFYRIPAYHQRPCPDYTFLFFRTDVSRGAKIFFQVQSALVMAAYGILLVRELLMSLIFLALVLINTFILAVASTLFGAPGVKASLAKRERKMKIKEGNLTREATTDLSSLRMVSEIVRQWFRLSFAMVWKQINGKESAGPNRPKLGFIPALVIFVLRTMFQLLCLVLFKWCPPIHLPAMIRTRVLHNESDHTKGVWMKLKNILTDKNVSALMQRAIYATNVICITWTILSVELTLAWNNIAGVNTLNSTGQLIPFIIGVVGFVRLLYGISVDHSKFLSTDMFMELLDVESPEVDPTVKWPERAVNFGFGDYVEDAVSLHDGYEAIFWVLEPRRRHSIDVITQEHFELDWPFPSSLEDRSYHLTDRGDYEMPDILDSERGSSYGPLNNAQSSSVRSIHYRRYPSLSPPADVGCSEEGTRIRIRSRPSTSIENQSQRSRRSHTTSRDGKVRGQQFTTRFERLLLAYFWPMGVCVLFLFPCLRKRLLSDKGGQNRTSISDDGSSSEMDAIIRLLLQNRNNSTSSNEDQSRNNAAVSDEDQSQNYTTASEGNQSQNNAAASNEDQSRYNATVSDEDQRPHNTTISGGNQSQDNAAASNEDQSRYNATVSDEDRSRHNATISEGNQSQNNATASDEDQSRHSATVSDEDQSRTRSRGKLKLLKSALIICLKVLLGYLSLPVVLIFLPVICAEVYKQLSERYKRRSERCKRRSERYESRPSVLDEEQSQGSRQGRSRSSSRGSWRNNKGIFKKFHALPLRIRVLALVCLFPFILIFLPIICIFAYERRSEQYESRRSNQGIFAEFRSLPLLHRVLALVCLVPLVLIFLPLICAWRYARPSERYESRPSVLDGEQSRGRRQGRSRSRSRGSWKSTQGTFDNSCALPLALRVLILVYLFPLVLPSLGILIAVCVVLFLVALPLKVIQLCIKHGLRLLKRIFWSRRLKSAVRELLSRYRQHITSLKSRESPQEAREDEKDDEVEVVVVSNHIRRKKDAIKDAFLARSLPALVDAWVSTLSHYCYRAGLLELAENLKRFKEFFTLAKEVRERKRKGEIAKSVQHEIMAKHWKALFSEEFKSAVEKMRDLRERKIKSGWESDTESDAESRSQQPGQPGQPGQPDRPGLKVAAWPA